MSGQKILIIGGTVFLGRHLVSAALERGHTVTTFNRGSKTLTEQSGVEKLIGDRNSNSDLVSALSAENRHWDIVIDTCAYQGVQVSSLLDVLKPSTDFYCFVSTISVYKESTGTPPILYEDSAILDSSKEAEAGGNTYGMGKGDCEAIAARVMEERSLIVRPGLIVGPHDPTGRFTYWAERLHRGGTVLAPGRWDRTIQFIDVRDLSYWMIAMAEQRKGGLFNATGPDYPLSMSEFLKSCQSVATEVHPSRPATSLTWLDDQVLLDAGVQPWMEMPLWIPDKDNSGIMSVDCMRAQAAGLRYRTLESTIKDTLEWVLLREPGPSKAGLAQEKESQILAAQSN